MPLLNWTSGQIRRSGESSTEQMPGERRSQSRWWFVAVAVATAALGLASIRVGSRGLAPDPASDARAVLSGLSAASILGLGLQLILVSILAERTSSASVRRPPTISPFLVFALVSGVLTAGVVVVFVDASVEFELQAAVGLGVAVSAMVAAIPSRAVLLGSERWRDLAFIGILGGLVRVSATAVAPDTGGFRAVLVGVALGELVSAFSAIVITRHVARIDSWPARTGRQLRIGTAATAGLALLLLLSSVSVGRFLGDEAAAFNQSASVARLVFVLAFVVAFVFFPAIAREPLGSVALRRNFHAALLLTGLASFAASAVILVQPGLFLDALSDHPVTSASTIRVLSLAFACYGLAVVSLMQYIAHGSRLALISWPLSAAVLGAQLLVDSPTELAWATLGAAAVLLVAASAPALARVQPVLRPDVVERASGSPVLGGPAVTVVIPSFNPGSAVVRTVEDVLHHFSAATIAVHVIVVSDGSTDESLALLDSIQRSDVTHIRQQSNEGKGSAIRVGFARCTTPLVGFIDADGDIPPAQLVQMVRIQQESEADIVYGSKTHLESHVSMSRVRVLYSRVFRFLVRRMFQLDISDTQTGIKLYSAALVREVLPVVEERGFALDLEFFVAARANGFQHFVEMPVTLRRQGGSTISISTVFAVLRDTARIFWRAKVTLRYLRSAASPRPNTSDHALARVSNSDAGEDLRHFASSPEFGP